MNKSTILKIVLIMDGAVKTVTRLTTNRWGVKVVRKGARHVEYDSILTNVGAVASTIGFIPKGITSDGKTIVYKKERRGQPWII